MTGLKVENTALTLDEFSYIADFPAQFLVEKIEAKELLRNEGELGKVPEIFTFSQIYEVFKFKTKGVSGERRVCLLPDSILERAQHVFSKKLGDNEGQEMMADYRRAVAAMIDRDANA
jgi:hypothetical protein